MNYMNMKIVTFSPNIAQFILCAPGTRLEQVGLAIFLVLDARKWLSYKHGLFERHDNDNWQYIILNDSLDNNNMCNIIFDTEIQIDLIGATQYQLIFTVFAGWSLKFEIEFGRN